MLQLIHFWMTKMPKVKNFHITIAAIQRPRSLLTETDQGEL